MLKREPVTYYLVVQNPDTGREHIRAAFVKRFQAENFIETRLSLQDRHTYTIQEVTERGDFE